MFYCTSRYSETLHSKRLDFRILSNVTIGPVPTGGITSIKRCFHNTIPTPFVLNQTPTYSVVEGGLGHWQRLDNELREFSIIELKKHTFVDSQVWCCPDTFYVQVNPIYGCVPWSSTWSADWSVFLH